MSKSICKHCKNYNANDNTCEKAKILFVIDDDDTKKVMSFAMCKFDNMSDIFVSDLLDLIYEGEIR